MRRVVVSNPRMGMALSTYSETMVQDFFWQSVSVVPTHTVARAKSVGRETFCTVGKIVKDIEENRSP